MAKPDYLHFFIDPNRCIGCQSCMQACSECDTHRGESMIHLEYVNRAESVQTVPVVCYDRTSVGKKPMCATVCPSQALFFGTREQIEQLRPLSAPINSFQFGQQTITTQVFVMVPRKLTTAAPHVDVTAAMEEQPRSRAVSLKMVSPPAAAPEAAPVDNDPFAGIEV